MNIVAFVNEKYREQCHDDRQKTWLTEDNLRTHDALVNGKFTTQRFRTSEAGEVSDPCSRARRPSTYHDAKGGIENE